MTYHDYIKNIKKTNYIIHISQILIVIVFIFLWQFLSDNNIINSFITSSPKKVIETLISLHSQNNLYKHIIITIKEVLISFIITSSLSLLIAIVLYNHKKLYRIIEPFLMIFNSLPKVALGPIIIIWLGANNKSIITIAVLISIIISIQNILTGFNNTDTLRIKLLESFHANKKDILFNLVLRENKYVIMSTLKINISMCLIGVITGEFLTSKMGIGYLILYGTQVFNLNLVMSSLFLLIIISSLLCKIVLLIQKK